MEIIGDYPSIERVVTGLWSLDHALGNKDGIGFPLTAYEVFGFQDVGKSNFSTSIAGIVANKLNKGIVLLPVEHIDRDLVENILTHVSFDGKVYILGGWDATQIFLGKTLKPSKEVPYPTDEINIDAFSAAIKDPTIAVGIVDSISSFNTISETEGSSAENNISGARRAKLTSNLARGIIYSRRFNPQVATILLSHKQMSMGMFPTNAGSSTTGGEAKKNLSKVRILLKRFPEKSINDLGHWVIEGMVEKFSFGREKRKFYNVVIGGQGVHIGLSNMYDCKKQGLCTFGSSITLDGKKYGAMRTVVQEALDGNDDFFKPFTDALNNPSSVSKVQTDEDEWTGDEDE
jgi:hypothetical protein